MAKIFSEGTIIDATWLNLVAKTVTDACGEKTTPAELRIHIGADKVGAASDVQSSLDVHKADSIIHTPAADIVLQAEKGVANGIPTLDGTAKIPAIFIPSTGGYAAVYDTRNLMVADGASHLSGQVFLVTEDATTTYNGEYTATIAAPVLIGDYYFNSGSVAAHTHAAAEVNVAALGVTVEADSASLHSDIGGVTVDLTTHEAMANIHFADVTVAGKQYSRTTTGWVEVIAGAGDLKSDFSVQMVGSPALGQDIATKASSEAAVTDRLRGYNADGTHALYSGSNIDTDAQYLINGVYAIDGNTLGTFPEGIYKVGFITVLQNPTRSYIVQIFENAHGVRIVRTTYDQGNLWYEWSETYKNRKLTQAEYDALTPAADTRYYIVG